MARSIDGGVQPTPRVSVVRPSRAQRDGLAALLLLAFGFALVRGLIGAETTIGRVAVGVIFGGVVLMILAGWLRLVRRPDLLEVSDEEIRYAPSSGREHPIIPRDHGETLRFVARSAGRLSFLALSQPGSGTMLALHLFSRKSVQAACEAHGWRFETE